MKNFLLPVVHVRDRHNAFISRVSGAASMNDLLCCWPMEPSPVRDAWCTYPVIVSNVCWFTIALPYSSLHVPPTCMKKDAVQTITLHMFCVQRTQLLNQLGQWFSTFLMPQPFNSVPHIAVTALNHIIIFVATS